MAESVLDALLAVATSSWIACAGALSGAVLGYAVASGATGALVGAAVGALAGLVIDGLRKALAADDER